MATLYVTFCDVGVSGKNGSGMLPMADGERGVSSSLTISGTNAQTNPDGTLKSIWDRTWATHVFNLEYAAADPATGFKAGHRSVTFPTVRYADSALWASPANVIA